MTRFLLDAQLSRHIAQYLRNAGHDASHAFDYLDPAADDRHIARLANQLQASVMSKDADFVDMAQRGLLEQTLVWIRVQNVSNNLLWLSIDRALPHIVSAVSRHDRIIAIR